MILFYAVLAMALLLCVAIEFWAGAGAMVVAGLLATLGYWWDGM